MELKLPDIPIEKFTPEQNAKLKAAFKEGRPWREDGSAIRSNFVYTKTIDKIIDSITEPGKTLKWEVGKRLRWDGRTMALSSEVYRTQDVLIVKVDPKDSDFPYDIKTENGYLHSVAESSLLVIKPEETVAEQFSKDLDDKIDQDIKSDLTGPDKEMPDEIWIVPNNEKDVWHNSRLGVNDIKYYRADNKEIPDVLSDNTKITPQAEEMSQREFNARVDYMLRDTVLNTIHDHVVQDVKPVEEPEFKVGDDVCYRGKGKQRVYNVVAAKRNLTNGELVVTMKCYITGTVIDNLEEHLRHATPTDWIVVDEDGTEWGAEERNNRIHLSFETDQDCGTGNYPLTVGRKLCEKMHIPIKPAKEE